MTIFDDLNQQDKSLGEAFEGSAAHQKKLADFHPYDTGLAHQVLSLVHKYETNIQLQNACSREEFTALLTGVVALRKTPGIPGPDQISFTTLPRCASSEEESACRAHLEQVFGIVDKESLLDFCQRGIVCNRQYLDFLAFWEGHPPFGLEELDEQPRQFFKIARDFSAQFYSVVARQGYLAWDISECLGHLRNGYACGLINRQEFDDLAEYWLNQTQYFSNWVDFAASLICGWLYWNFRQGAKLPELNQNLDLYRRLVSILLDDNTAWGSGMWYKVNPGAQWSTPLKRPNVKQIKKETSMMKNAQNNLRLNPKEFEIDGNTDAGEEGVLACRRLIAKWTPQLEDEMLEAFIRLYYDEMFGDWGPEDEEESKEYWPEIKTPGELLKYTGTDVTLYALEDAIYARSKTGAFPYESQHVPLCVILLLGCPWDEEHGWAAAFVDEKLVKVDRDIVDCVWLD